MPKRKKLPSVKDEELKVLALISSWMATVTTDECIQVIYDLCDRQTISEAELEKGEIEIRIPSVALTSVPIERKEIKDKDYQTSKCQLNLAHLSDSVELGYSLDIFINKNRDVWSFNRIQVAQNENVASAGHLKRAFLFCPITHTVVPEQWPSLWGSSKRTKKNKKFSAALEEKEKSLVLKKQKQMSPQQPHTSKLIVRSVALTSTRTTKEGKIIYFHDGFLITISIRKLVQLINKTLLQAPSCDLLPIAPELV